MMTPDMWKTAIALTRATSAFLSVIACFSFLIYVIVVFKRRFFKLPSVRFLSYLQTFLLFASLNHMLTLYTAYKTDKDWVCIFQAVSNQFFSVGSFVWSVVIAIFLFSTIVLRKLTKKRSVLLFEGCSIIIVFLISGFLTGLPFIGNTYGNSGKWCWIDQNKELGMTWIFAAFYGPLWIAIGIILILYSIVLVKVCRNFGSVETSEDDADRKRKKVKAYLKLMGYPLMMVLIFIIPTFHRISNFFITDTDYSNYMSMIHTIISPLIGFFNVLIYFSNPMEGKNMLRSCRQCWKNCCSRNYTNIDERDYYLASTKRPTRRNSID